MAKIPEAFAKEVEELLNDLPDREVPDVAIPEWYLQQILKTQIHTNYLLAMIACLYMHEVEKSEIEEQRLEEEARFNQALQERT